MKNPIQAVYRLVKTRFVYGILLRQYGIKRHRALIKTADRSQSHTYTCFYRSPGQIDALTGPVMKFLLKNRKPEKFVINVFAGSTGAESYTIASVLLQNFPGLDFQIFASDLHQATVDQAIEAVYSAQEVFGGSPSEAFVANTFEKAGDRYKVRPEVRARVSFRPASLLDLSQLSAQHKPADLCFVQNVFCHLDEGLTRQAWPNILPFMKQKSVLFIDGMDLDLREELTEKSNLAPLDYRCREIHEYARMHIGERWWNYYYGMEPYAGWIHNHVRRFSTIFFKGN